MMRPWTSALAGTVVAALAFGGLACPPNEAIVCGSKTENLGPGCAATYDLCAGGSDRIECRPANGGVSCSCIENGIAKKSFQSDDACNVTPDTLKKRAADGCGWKFDADK